MLAWCLLSGDPHPCEPCARHSSGLGSHHPPFYAFHWHPYGTCGGEKFPVRCSVVKTGMLGWRSSPGSWWWPLCHSFWGGLGRTTVAAVTSTTAWLAVWDSGGLPGGEPKAHLFVGVQH